MTNNEIHPRTLDDLYDVLIEIREAIKEGGQVDRYCLPLIEEGEIVCAGGLLLRPSVRDGKRVEDKWFHPLPAERHGLVPFGDDGGSIMRRNHSLWTSETTANPQPPATSAVGAVQAHEDAAHEDAVDRLAQEQADAAARVDTETGEVLEGVVAEGPPAADAAEWQKFYNDEVKPRLRDVLDGRFGMTMRSRRLVKLAKERDEDQGEAKAQAVAEAMEAFWTVFREVPLLAICEAEDGTVNATPETIEAGHLPLVVDILERYAAGEDVIVKAKEIGIPG